MRILIASALVVLADQVTKGLIRAQLQLYESVSVLGSFFRLTYVENDGIAFGIGVGAALPIFTLFSIIAAIMIIYYLYKEWAAHWLVKLGLALVLGGAIGNIIDRIWRGSVVDFLDFGIGNYRFFVFNIADSAVTVGVALYLVATLFYPAEAAQNLSSADEVETGHVGG